MNAYLFILAIVDKELLELDGPGGIRFEHKVVMAENHEDAYKRGSEEAEKAGLIPVKEGEVANDYVIKLLED